MKLFITATLSEARASIAKDFGTQEENVRIDVGNEISVRPNLAEFEANFFKLRDTLECAALRNRGTAFPVVNIVAATLALRRMANCDLKTAKEWVEEKVRTA